MAKNIDSDQYPNILGQGTKLKGELSFSENVMIDGEMEGNVTVVGTLVLGEHALLTGGIDAKNVQVQGTVKGKIKANGLVSLSATAHVSGEISCTLISIQEGAILEGKVAMQKDAKQMGMPEPLMDGEDSK